MSPVMRAVTASLASFAFYIIWWRFRPPGVSWDVWFWLAFIPGFTLQYLMMKVTVTLKRGIPEPPPGKRYASCTPSRPIAYHRSLKEATDALRPKQARRWNQRVWPEGRVYEWVNGEWITLYQADGKFTRRG